MKLYTKIILTIICLLIYALGGLSYPLLCNYQDEVYEHDRAIYDSLVAKEDSIFEVNKERFFNEWKSNNDTTLRKVKTIKKKPTYGELGYYKKTDKLRCSKERFSKDFICEPVKEWVTTDYYIDGYHSDTVWTDGYKSREEWMMKAENYAINLAIKERKDIEYTGHEYHYLIKSDSGWFIIYVLFCGSFFFFVVFGIPLIWSKLEVRDNE